MESHYKMLKKYKPLRLSTSVIWYQSIYNHLSFYFRWICALVLLLGCTLSAINGLNAAEKRLYDCLTTPNGIPLRVVVKKKDVSAYENQDFTGTEYPLKFFRKYFIFKESGQGFLIGDATIEASVLGWVRKDDVLQWDTNQALFFINKKETGREPVRIWRLKEDVNKRDKPYFEEILDRDYTTEPFPLLASESPLYKIAFLWDAEGPLPALERNLREKGGDQVIAKDLLTGKEVNRNPDQEGKGFPGGQKGVQQMIEQAKRMDVVLVMDTTGSMGPYINEVKAKLIDIVESLSKMEGPTTPIHIGVVAYRDYADEATTYLTRELDLTTDYSKVKEFLKSLSPDGGAGINEAVCDALYKASQAMSWGNHSFKVMCLVGDAPPHTHDDKDITELKKRKVDVKSNFFGRTFEESLKIVKDKMNNIQVYSLCVGGDVQMKEMFKQFVDVDKPERFLSLEKDSTKFIKALEDELRKGRIEHTEGMVLTEDIYKGKRPVSSLTDKELELLKCFNFDPNALQEMQKELIQTGWCMPKIGEDSCAAVYLSRNDLDDWSLKLREDLLQYKEKEEDVLVDISEVHGGGGVVKGIGGLFNRAKDLPYKPDVFKASFAGMEDEAKIVNLRRKLNNIAVLLLTEELFSEKYEEGWVPFDYLPGSVAEFGKSTAD